MWTNPKYHTHICIDHLNNHCVCVQAGTNMTKRIRKTKYWSTTNSKRLCYSSEQEDVQSHILQLWNLVLVNVLFWPIIWEYTSLIDHVQVSYHKLTHRHLRNQAALTKDVFSPGTLQVARINYQPAPIYKHCYLEGWDWVTRRIRTHA